MHALRWVAPAILAVVMAAAAGAKLSNRVGTRTSFAALGLPAPAVLGTVVPVVELIAAVTLVAVPRVGAALALVLLAGFSGFLATLLLRDDPTPCACFGQVRAMATSPADLARNSALISLAVITLYWSP